MDEVDRQAEHDANVEVIKKALAHFSKDELLHIAATKTVDLLYIESAHNKASKALNEVIAFQDAAMRRSSIAHLGELKQQARQTVRHLISLMPQMEGMARTRNAQGAAAERYAGDPKQKARAEIEDKWLLRRQERDKGRWFAEFARECQKLYCNVLEDPETIRKWTVGWEKKYVAALQNGTAYEKD